MMEQPPCPLCRGAGFVTYRDGIAYETHDVEKEEHLIEDCPECKGNGKVSDTSPVRPTAGEDQDGIGEG